MRATVRVSYRGLNNYNRGAGARYTILIIKNPLKIVWVILEAPMFQHFTGESVLRRAPSDVDARETRKSQRTGPDRHPEPFLELPPETPQACSRKP